MTSVSRRGLLATALAAAGLSATGLAEAKTRKKKVKAKTKTPSDFVTVEGTVFKLRGQTYRYVGANIWYGAYLGSTAAFGDRARLVKELDDMKALGIDNLRVLALSELSPLNNSLDPATLKKPGDYNEDLLTGLDFLLAEMNKRDMRAVLYLTNFWEWSGGMTTLQYYVNGGHYINAGDPAHPWPEFANESSKFYSSQAAKDVYYANVRKIVTRTNSITGKAYVQDPTVMAWQLSNEPRPGGSEASIAANEQAYYGWIKDTAALIRSLDKNHLVSLGHEGLMGANNQAHIVEKAHEHIDYLTAHIWPQNWSWVDGKNLAGTFDGGAEKVQTYINAHIKMAQKLGKPVVFEEFGFPRDDTAYEPGTPTVYKDRFYAMIYKAVEDAISHDTPVAGSNFWAWGGAGRALHKDYKMLRGETAYVGDPPHEPQGWYSVFNTDTSTQALIKAHAEKLKTLRPAKKAA
jgi:mannan endo-1,4-beta-mannosidase